MVESITRHPLLREQILEILRDEITNRRPVGGLMPAEMNLARQFRVSRKTVRAAYAVLEEEGLIERHRGLGTIVVAKTPRARRTGEIALVFFTSAEMMFLLPFYTRLLTTICAEATRRQFYTRLLTHDSRKREYRNDWQEHISHLDEAVATLAVGIFRPEALQLLSKQMPVVAVDAGGPFDFCDSVAADDFEAGRLATQHLLDLGHRRIGFLGEWEPEAGAILDPAHVRRHEGYCQAMRQAGIDPGDELRYDAKGAFRVVSSLMQDGDPPTALVGQNDQGAVAAVQAVTRQGKSIPGDLSVVGVGNAPDAAAMGLTTVDLYPDGMGQAAVDLLQRRLAEPGAPPTHRVIPVSLVERESTRPIRWS